MAGVKLFIEGVADRKFLQDVVLNFFKKKLDTKADFVELGGYTNIDNADVLFQSNSDSGGTNLLFLDTDYPNTNGGFEKRFRETIAKKAELNIDFELFLFPNQHDDGDLEVLLERIINPAHQDIFDCWADYEGCLSARARNYTVPARKTKIYGYMEALHGTSKSQKEKAKEQNRDYLNAAHWDLNNQALARLVEFLRPHF